MEFHFFIHPEGEVLLLCKSLKIRVIRVIRGFKSLFQLNPEAIEDQEGDHEEGEAKLEEGTEKESESDFCADQSGGGSLFSLNPVFDSEGEEQGK